MGDESKDWDIWLDEYAKTVGNITIDLSDYASSIAISGNDDYINYDDWLNVHNTNTHNDITLTGGGEEMLRVDKDGFYVRGVRVEADAKEAEQVYKAFKEWLTWASLSRNSEE